MLSIVIPVHNAEATLDRCLSSILDQSFRDFEVICIENGSSDNSWQILAQYQARDPRIVAHTLGSTASVSKARNKGLDLSKGDWILFVDSDDWIADNYLQELTSEVRSGQIDLVISRWTEYPQVNIRGRQTTTIDKRNSGYFNAAILGMVWGKLYSRDLIEGIRFEELIVAEDAVFFLEIATKFPKIKFIDTAGYCYLFHESSSSAKIATRQEYVLALFKFFYVGENIVIKKKGPTKLRSAWKALCERTIIYWGSRIDNELIWDTWISEFRKVNRHFGSFYNALILLFLSSKFESRKKICSALQFKLRIKNKLSKIRARTSNYLDTTT